MAENNAKHQANIESEALKHAASVTKRGQLFGLVIGIFALTASIVSLSLGYETAAMVLGGTTVVGLVTVFVTGRIKQD